MDILDVVIHAKLMVAIYERVCYNTCKEQTNVRKTRKGVPAWRELLWIITNKRR